MISYEAICFFTSFAPHYFVQTIYHFLVSNSEAAKNAKLLREFQLIPRLLLTLRDTSLSQPTVAAISNVLSLLLQGFPNPYDLLR